MIKRISAAIRAGRTIKTVHFDGLKVAPTRMEGTDREEEESAHMIRLAKRLEGWEPPGWSPPGMRRGHPGSTPAEEEFHISENSESDGPSWA